MLLVQLCTHVSRLKVAYVVLILLNHARFIFAIVLSLCRKRYAASVSIFTFKGEDGNACSSNLSHCNDVCMNLHQSIASSSTCACVQGVFGQTCFISVAVLHRYTELNS